MSMSSACAAVGRAFVAHANVADRDDALSLPMSRVHLGARFFARKERKNMWKVSRENLRAFLVRPTGDGRRFNWTFQFAIQHARFSFNPLSMVRKKKNVRENVLMRGLTSVITASTEFSKSLKSSFCGGEI